RRGAGRGLPARQRRRPARVTRKGRRMANYSFVTTWRVPAPIDKVWEALRMPSQGWWPNTLSSRTLTPGTDGVGARYERVTRGRLGGEGPGVGRCLRPA